MKTLPQLMAARTNLIRNDPRYRHQLAMRDERDFSNDHPEPTKEITERRVVEDGHQLKIRVGKLEKELWKHIKPDKEQPFVEPF